MEIKFRTQLGELLEHLRLSGHAAEVGVAEGRNSEVLIASPAITKLYMIDNWATLEQSGDGGYPMHWHRKNYNEALERTKPFKLKRVVLKGLSSEMIKQIPDNSLILAYIDGDHSYEGCMADLKGIYPKMKSGGVISNHDVLSPQYGVGKAIKEFMAENGYGADDLHFTEENGDASMVSCWFIKK